MDKILWPGWETVRLIGQGSFGTVYEIERDVFGRKEKAALKVMRVPQNESDIEELYDSGYDEASVTATFQSHLQSIINEYSLMRQMNGAANVVNCDDFRYVQHDDGIGWDIFIKMELLTPLTKAVSRNPSETQVIQISRDLCKALILCRKYDIVHRDIKPQNIFISPNGDYKLGDFGVAKTMEKTSGATKTGTYKYMAPEVYNNRPYSCTADIYSVGLVIHWLLNERRSPFVPLPPEPVTVNQEELSRIKRFSGEPIPAPKNGSKELKRIVLKACAYDPADRYHTADEMLEDLNSLLFGTAKKEPVITLTPVAPKATEPETPADTTQKDTSAEQAEETDMTEQTAGVWEKEEETVTESEDEEDAGTVGVFSSKPAYTATSASQPATDDDATVGVFAAAQPKAPVHEEAQEMTEGTVGVFSRNSGGKKQNDEAESASPVYPRKYPVYSEKTAHPPLQKKTKPWLKIIAAVLLICLGIGIFTSFLGNHGSKTRHQLAYRAFSDLGYDRNDVLKINFVRMNLWNAPKSAHDVSAAGDRSILAWLDNGTLTVASNGIIAANINSSYLFAGFHAVRAIQFNDCFDTSDVTNMSGMFFGCISLVQLDLSGFDTTKVTDMAYMFYGCRSLTSTGLICSDSKIRAEYS